MIVPKTQSKFSIKIYTSTHTLYSKDDLKFENQLTPLSTGVIVERSEPQVKKKTDLYLRVRIPTYADFPYHSFSVVVNNLALGPLEDSTQEFELNEYTNPATVANEPGYNVNICNITHCIYTNTNTRIIPELEPIMLTNVQTSLPEEMSISTVYAFEINSTSPLKKDIYTITMPSKMI